MVPAARDRVVPAARDVPGCWVLGVGCRVLGVDGVGSNNLQVETPLKHSREKTKRVLVLVELATNIPKIRQMG